MPLPPPPNDDDAKDGDEYAVDAVESDAENAATRGLDDDDDDDDDDEAAAARTIPIALLAVSAAGGRRKGVDGVWPNGDATRAIGSPAAARLIR